MRCSAFRPESTAEQESRTARPAKAELQGRAGLDTSSENAYGFIPGFTRFLQTTQDYLNSRSVSAVSDAVQEITLQGDILVAFDQTLKASGSPSSLQVSPQHPNTREHFGSAVSGLVTTVNCELTDSKATVLSPVLSHFI